MPTVDTILKLLGQSQYPEKMVVDNQDTDDIIECIMQKHDACEEDYDKFAYLFDKGNVYDTCKGLWEFCKENIAYKVEKTKAQYVSRPYTILTRGYCDCKGYALFCGGVLGALCRRGKRISWAYRFASYRLLRKSPEHVFICVTIQGHELFIDPVFNIFDYRKPALWTYDYKMNQAPASIGAMYATPEGGLNVLSDCDCDIDTDIMAIGATTSQIGTEVLAVAPALATIPVAGWIAGGAAALVGGLLTVFGNKHVDSTGVLWLIQLYDEKVRGITGETASNAPDAEMQTAQAFFSVVLGVPIYDRLDFNTLQTGNPNSNVPTNMSDQARGQAYINRRGLQNQVSLEMATAAAHIAAQLNPYQAKPGAWANLTAAPWTIQGQQAAAAASPGGNTIFSSLFSNKWLLIALVGAGLFFLLSSDHKK